MWNALLGALKEWPIKKISEPFLQVGQYLQNLPLPISLSTGNLSRGALWKGLAMGGSFSCSSSEREGLPTVPSSLEWSLASWFICLSSILWPYQSLAELSDSLHVTTNGLVSLPRTELNKKQPGFPFFCCHVKRVAVILFYNRKAVVKHTKLTLLPNQCSMHVHVGKQK